MSKRHELMKQMQLMCHKEGIEEFISLVTEMLYSASNDLDYMNHPDAEIYRLYAEYMEAIDLNEDNWEEECNEEWVVTDWEVS